MEISDYSQKVPSRNFVFHEDNEHGSEKPWLACYKSTGLHLWISFTCLQIWVELLVKDTCSRCSTILESKKGKD